MYLSHAVNGHRPSVLSKRAGLAPHPGSCRCGCVGAVARWAYRRMAADLTYQLAAQGQAAAATPFLKFRADSAFSDQPRQSQRPVVLTNLRLFDGITAALRDGVNIRIAGDRIQAIVPAGDALGDDVEVIDCGGRVVMPGLIDAHWHSTLCGVTELEAMTADVAFLHLVAAREAQNTLMRGFTTVRDAGGPSFALKRAIDEGVVFGPRIFPSGAMISQTSGHGDFRMRYDVTENAGLPSHGERAGMSVLADGADAVLRRAREQLMLGASQLKMMAGGGVTSVYDPLESLQFTDAELRAGVAAARDWGTYVMVHVYTAAGIERAVQAGVRSIEHGQLTDEKTAKLMADNGVWWSLQPFLGDEDANPHADPRSHAKQMMVAQGTVRAYEFAQRLKVKTAWGTDILFSPETLPRHGHMLAKMTRFYAPLEALRIATGQNGELVGMSGARNSYPGQVGVLAQDAMADLLVVDGDPAANLDFLTQPEQSLRLIMKDGKIYKSSL